MTGLFHFANLVRAGIRDNALLWMLIAGFALFPIFTHFADLPFWNDVAMRIMLLGMAAMGLNLVLGYGGMVSFGHAAFIGIGAYCVGISQFLAWQMACFICLLALVFAARLGW